MDGLYRPIQSHRRVVEEYVTDPSNNKNKVPILEPINHTIIECNNDNDTDDKRGVLMIDDDDVRWWQVSRMSRKSVFFFLSRIFYFVFSKHQMIMYTSSRVAKIYSSFNREREQENILNGPNRLISQLDKLIPR